MTAVAPASLLLLEVKFWPEMKTKEKRDNKQQQKQKQQKTNKNEHLKKLHNP